MIFDGAGCQTFFNVMAANYNYFEGITFRKRQRRLSGRNQEHCGVERLHPEAFAYYDVGRAVQADWSGSKNFYIADNVMIGRHDPNKMMGWTGELWSKFPGYPGVVAIGICGQSLRAGPRRGL